MKAAELRMHEDPVDLFFLAMTASNLGEIGEARQYYDRGVARRNATLPKSPLLIRMNEEAAEVLGIEE